MPKILREFVKVEPVADLTALAALDTTTYVGSAISCYVRDEKATYMLDLTSTMTADGVHIVQPAAGSGRWFRVATRLDDFSITGNGGVANTYTATYDERLTAYEDGMRVYFKADVTNTGASTINIDGAGAKAIIHPDGSAVDAGEIPADTYVHLVYNSDAGGGAGAFEIVTQVLLRSREYITATATNVLSADQSIGALTTGLLKNTVAAGTGTLSRAIAHTDYQPEELITAGGAADAYTAAIDAGVVAYAAGLELNLLINADNTGASTVDVNGIGAQAIKLQDGSDPAAGDLANGAIARLIYDGTNFQLMNPMVSGFDVVTENILYVSKNGNDANSGNINDPFLTVQAAVNASSDSDVIVIFPGTYTEDVTINNKVNLTIFAYSALARLNSSVFITGEFTLGGTSVACGFKGIRFSNSGGTPALSISTGGHAFNECSFTVDNNTDTAVDISGTLSSTIVFNNLDGFGTFDLAHLIAGGSVYINDCQSSNILVNATGTGVVQIQNATDIGRITHADGFMLLNNISIITAVGGVSINSSATTTPATNILIVSNISMQQGGGYGTFTKSGDCLYVLADVNYDVPGTTLSGTRANFARFGVDISANHTAVNYTAANASVNAHIAGIDTELGNKLDDTLNDTNIFVGNGSNVATGVAMSGDTNIANTGAVTAQPALITGKPGATVASGDLLVVADVDDANALKQVTAQSIADLAVSPVTFDDSTFRVFDNVDNTKLMAFEVSGVTTSTTRTYTVPDIDGNMLTDNSTATLTNKTFDANGTGNSISNIDVADLANGTDGELITWDATGAPATVAVGTSGQILTSNGAGAAPTFQDNAALSETLADGDIFIGSAGNVATAQTMQGDATIINDGTLTIANDAITLAKMASGTAGNLITYDASGDPAAVATGTAGQLLKSNGAGAAPTFQDAGFISNTLTNSQFLVGNGSNVATDVAMSGDMSLANTGAVTAEPSIITGKAAATVASGDLVLIADINDSNNLKQVTAQSIADLAGVSSTFDDSTFRVFDNGDNTKNFALEVSNVTTATTRTATVPDNDGLLMMQAANGIAVRTSATTSAARTITGTANEIAVADGDGVAGNPTLSLPAALTFTGKTVTGGTFNAPSITVLDNAFTMQDNVDNTKQAVFELSGITTATTRTYTLPDVSDTVLTTTSTATLTNKTFDANAAGNSLSNVDVADLANGTDGELITWDNAGAPTTIAVGTSGQVLTTQGAGAEPVWANQIYDIPFNAGFAADGTTEDVAVQTYGEMVVARSGSFTGEAGYADVAPTGADLIVDIEKNGTSIYTTPPEFAATSQTLTAGTLKVDGTEDFVSGDRITFKITQIGSTEPGEGIRFTVQAGAR